MKLHGPFHEDSRDICADEAWLLPTCEWITAAVAEVGLIEGIARFDERLCILPLFRHFCTRRLVVSWFFFKRVVAYTGRGNSLDQSSTDRPIERGPIGFVRPARISWKAFAGVRS
jgi:hypothetical protein